MIPEADAQPVDVAVASDGTRFVSDAGLHRLLRYTANGDLAEVREMPQANSVNGPHLALREDGSLLVSEPESGRIVELDARGAQRAAWTLPVADQEPAKPVGVTVDSSGRVWTVDSNLNRVVRLE
jgi:streptogramin lyase